jgi:hypothetical protein
MPQRRHKSPRAFDLTQGIRFAFSVSERVSRLLLRLPRRASRRIMGINRAEYEAGNGGLGIITICLSSETAELQRRAEFSVFATELRNRVPRMADLLLNRQELSRLQVRWFNAPPRAPRSARRGLSRRPQALMAGLRIPSDGRGEDFDLTAAPYRLTMSN